MKKKYLGVPYVIWMLIFILSPLILIVVYAIMETTDMGKIIFTWEYLMEAFNAVHLSVLLRSVWNAVLTTVICLLLAYPAAMILARLKTSKAGLISLLFILPMWMNFLMRTYAWRALLDMNGPINQLIMWLGFQPQQLLYTEGAVVFGLVYNFLPFMLLPIYSVFVKLDPSYEQAAQDLGANKLQVLTKVTIPMTRSGIISGITMVFMPTVSTFVISKLLGGGNYMMYGELIEMQFMTLNNWNTGSALSLIMLVLLAISVVVMRKYDDKDDEVRR